MDDARQVAKNDKIKENLWLFESSPCRVRKMRRLYRKRNLPTGTEWRSLPKKLSQQGIPSVDSFLRLSRARQSAVKKSESCLHERALFIADYVAKPHSEMKRSGIELRLAEFQRAPCLHERARAQPPSHTQKWQGIEQNDKENKHVVRRAGMHRHRRKHSDPVPEEAFPAGHERLLYPLL